MFNVVKVQPAVGHPVMYLVYSSGEVYNNLHAKLTEHFTKEHGEYTSFEYLESIAVPDFSIQYSGVQRVINMDELDSF